MHYDGIVIGGSYAGLSAAIHLARARRHVCVIDAGRPRNRFADASHGFFGQDGARPSSMIGQARAQVLAYPTVTLIDGEAIAARKDDGHGFVIELASGESVSGSGVVLAHGVEDVLPQIPSMAERWGTSVLHCPYCHGYEYSERRLGVLNLVPHSSQQALLIAEWGPTTFFLNGEVDLEDNVRAQLHHRGITIEEAPIADLVGDAPSLSGIRLADGRSVAVEALFIAPFRRLSPLAAQLGCEVDEGPLGPTIRTDSTKMTTVAGVYAAGDATTMAGNATLASADGVLAGVALHRSLVFAS
jgi:thioredoxin reductase